MAIGDLSDQANDVYIGGRFMIEWWKAGDSSMYPGYVAMDDDADEIKVCATNGTPFTVVGLKSSHDIDTLYAEHIDLFGYVLGQGTRLWIAHDTDAQALAKGQMVLRSAAIAGMIESGNTVEVSIGRSTRTVATAADVFCDITT